MKHHVLSERDLSILRDIGGFARDLDAEKRRDLARLAEAGLVRRCCDEAPIYALTGRAVRLLAAQGVPLAA